MAQIIGIPGVSSGRSTTARRVFLQGDAKYLAQSLVISGANSRDPGNTSNVDNLRPGVVMGKITSGGKYAPSIYGVTTNNEAVGATTIEMAAGVVTEILRRKGASGTFKLTGNSIANGTVITETVTYSAAASSTAFTVTALTNAFLAGAWVQPVDGSETPMTFIAKEDGVKVTDIDGTSIDVMFPEYPIGGTVDASQLVHWTTDTAMQAWLVARLNDASSGRFVFDHKF